MKEAQPTFLQQSTSGFRLQIAPEFAERLRVEGLIDATNFDCIRSSAKQVSGGRGPNWLLRSVRPQEFAEAIRIRPNRHGGVLGPWLGERFLSPARAMREFKTWTTLRERGISLPGPVFAVSRRRRLFWHSAFATLNRQDACDSFEWIARRPSTAQLHAACVAFGIALRQFHDAGGIHGDLQLRNMLVEPTDQADPKAEREAALVCTFIDLDRTRIVGLVSARNRVRELLRFARSLEKLGHPELLTSRLKALTLSAYCMGDRKLRRSMLRWSPLERAGIRRHRLAWRIKQIFSRASAAALLSMVVTIGVGCEDGSISRSETDQAGAQIANDRSLPSPSEWTESSPRWSLLVTGDTGRTRSFPELFEGQLSVAKAMVQEAIARPVDGLVLLGDNFYWRGLERKHLVDRIRINLIRPYCYFLELSGPRSSEVTSACKTDLRAGAPIPIFAVLGNHDLENPESILLHRKAVLDFVPDWTMSQALAQTFEVAPGVSLILFESELAIKDPVAIQQALEKAIMSAAGPWRILATHRPVATDDLGFPPRGGYPHFVRDAIAKSGRSIQIVMAGHHHSLQAFEIKQPTPALHLGLGSGSRAKPPLAQDHPDVRFGAIDLGFARIDLIGHNEQERLSVSIFDAPRWPWLGLFETGSLRAKFQVNVHGQVSELEID